MSQTHVGIDVSKHQFDVALWGRPEEDDRLVNDRQAQGGLAARRKWAGWDHRYLRQLLIP